MNVAFFKQEAKNRQTVIAKKAKRPKSNISSRVRYIEFVPTFKYKLYRNGIPLMKAPDELRDTLSEAHLFHFRNDDIYIDRRNPNTPKYIGVLQVWDATLEEFRYFHPLQPDLKAIYRDRTNMDKCWDKMDSDDTPYWIDVYAIRKSKKGCSSC